MIYDNPNIKGTSGEAAVCKDLLRHGYNVFLEFGNHSKVDLIVLDENFNAIKVQIKAVQSLNDCVSIYSVKT